MSEPPETVTVPEFDPILKVQLESSVTYLRNRFDAPDPDIPLLMHICSNMLDLIERLELTQNQVVDRVNRLGEEVLTLYRNRTILSIISWTDPAAVWAVYEGVWLTMRDVFWMAVKHGE